MKYSGMPMGMWALFGRSFRRNLVRVWGFSPWEAERIGRAAKKRYREIIGSLPEFEKGDRFRMNIVSCAMFSAFLLSLPRTPKVGEATDYYREAMMTGPMRAFCRLSGKKKFTKEDVEGMRRTAAFRAADRNPYSWNMDFLPYPDGSGYEARFTHCGICTLMKELGLSEMVPAMCSLDHTMSEAGGASVFVREHTLASGGGYCDCGYKKRG